MNNAPRTLRAQCLIWRSVRGVLSLLLLAWLAGSSRESLAGTEAANSPAHWAFRPPQPQPPPATQNAEWRQTEIDSFILARLERENIAPAPLADPRTLIRRMTFDLTGLPPAADEVRSFVDAFGRDRGLAVNRLIERLLASPHYGEQWGRHWLDVARYSDTKGYVYDREERRFVHAPTYRDWIIRAFNLDLPYDRFLLLQIAGDQLLPADSPDLAAMGFITGGRRFIGVTHEIIDDRIDVVTRGAMALTVQCARCHDHKYDPVSIQDYYSLYGVFHGSDDQLVQLASSDDAELARRRKKLAETMSKRREEAGERLRARVGDYLMAQLELHNYPEEGFDQIFSADDILPKSVRRWRDYLLTTKREDDPVFGPWHRLHGLEGAPFAEAAGKIAEERQFWNPLVAEAFAKAPKDMRDVAARYGRVFAEAEANAGGAGASELRAFLRDPSSPTVVPDTGIASNEGFFPTSQVEELWRLQGEVERRMIELGTPAALILAERAPEPDPRVFKRGSPSQLGETVPRRFLEVIAGSERQPFRQGNGRLELARAIATAENPLTARVMVNRIWQHHFGQGLVRTPSDFGLRAEPPSHPELLDWLALRFIAEGWSVKAMHRLILASAVYQTAAMPPGAASKDPDNRLLAHFPVRRLSFEQTRDAMLAASGGLDLSSGGKRLPVTDAANQRRTIYAFVDRQFLPGVFRTFDFANPDIHVAVRHETTVPQQALFFLNGPFAAERAREVASSLPEGPVENRITRLYEHLLQRTPSQSELAAGVRFLNSAEMLPPVATPVGPHPAWQYGTAEYDEMTKTVNRFTPFPHYNGAAWQGAESWPGGASGWAQLTATGGHPGNTRAYACVRRWVAPRDLTITISGTLVHEPEAGDGVRAFVVSSRSGELKRAQAHHSKADLSVDEVSVKGGDAIDFVVDIGSVLNSDQFLWAPKITAADQTWDAQNDFGGPATEPRYLTPWEQYAQVLLLSNEFAFVD